MIYPKCKRDFQQVYVTAEGYVVPCSWIGSEPHMKEYRRLHGENLKDFSLANRELDEITADARYKKISETWETSEPFTPCKKFCSGPVDNAQELREISIPKPHVDSREKMGPFTYLGSKGSQTICSFPFNHVATDTLGRYKVCCAAKPSPISIQDSTAEEFFDGDYLKNIRERMLKGERVSECETCYESEEKFQVSKRVRSRSEMGPDEWPDQPRLKSMDLRPTNKCNAKCANCNPGDSSGWEKDSLELEERKIIGRQPLLRPKSLSELTGKEIASAATLKGLTSLYLAGGEPMLMESTPWILEQLNEDCAVQINTNLSQLPERVLVQLKRMKNLTLICSVDGIGEAFHLMRYPIRFDQFKRNIEQVFASLPRVEVILTYTMSVLNLNQLAAVVRFASEISSRHRKVHLDLNLLHSPEYLQVSGMSQKRRVEIAGRMREQLSGITGFIEGTSFQPELQSLLKAIEQEKERNQSSMVQRQLKQYVLWLQERRPSCQPGLVGSEILDDLAL